MSQVYDALGRVVSETFPDNEIVTYNYNQAGWLSSVDFYVNSITYNARGQRTQIQYANNATSTMEYFEDGNTPSFRLKRRHTSTTPTNSSLLELNRWVRSWEATAPPPAGQVFVYRGGICVADPVGTCVGGDITAEQGIAPAGPIGDRAVGRHPESRHTGPSAATSAASEAEH